MGAFFDSLKLIEQFRRFLSLNLELLCSSDGRLVEGDQILAIDGQPLDSNISHEQAISILQKARGLVELVVARSTQGNLSSIFYSVRCVSLIPQSNFFIVKSTVYLAHFSLEQCKFHLRKNCYRVLSTNFHSWKKEFLSFFFKVYNKILSCRFIIFIKSFCTKHCD